MSRLTDPLNSLPDPILLLVVAAFVIAESGLGAGLVLPGEAVLLLAGFQAGTGRLSLTIVLTVAVLAALTGDQVGYLFGERALRVLRRTPAGRWLTEDRLKQARRHLDGQPLLLLAAGRFVGPIRALLPSVAGASHARYRKLLAYSATSVIVWAPTVVLAGYFAHNWIERWGGAVTGIVAAGVVAYLTVAARRRRRRPPHGNSELPIRSSDDQRAENSL